MTDLPQKPDPRTYFAAERTFLAWIRTGIALMGFGFVAARFGIFLREAQVVLKLGSAHSSRASLWSGTGLVLVGVAVNVLALLRYRDNVHRLNRGEMTSTEPSALATGTAGLLAVMGVGLAGYLIYFR